MKWEQIKPVAEIAALLLSAFGAGGLLVWWKRITNHKQAVFWKDKYSLQKIEIKNLKEDYAILKAAYDKTTVLIDAAEEIAMKDPKIAKDMLDLIIKNKAKSADL